MDQDSLNKEMLKMGSDKFWSQVHASKGRGSESRTPHGTRMVQGVLSPIAEAIRGWMKDCSEKSCGQYHSALPIISDLDPEVLAAITARSCVDSAGSGQSYTQTARKIGGLVEDEIRFRYFKKKAPRLWNKLKDQVNSSTVYYRKRTIIVLAMNRTDQGFEAWPSSKKIKIGCLLLELFVKVTGCVEILTKRLSRHKTQAYLTFTQKSAHWIDMFNQEKSMAEPYWMPTVEPPEDWTSPFAGGYSDDVAEDCSVVKGAKSKYLLNDVANADMPEVYECLNHLQKTAWKINPFVHQVVHDIMKSGHSYGDLPSMIDIEFPDKPDDIDTNAESRKQWRAIAKGIIQDNIALRTKRVRLLRIMFLADKFLKEPKFYYPYQLDFRGRVYCMSSFLNPQSDDLGKGLLHFSKGEAIKHDEDIRWLKVSGANLFGEDKVTLDERVAWVDQNEAEFEKVVADPLSNRFWTEADSPFQFLAWCDEYVRFKKIGRGFITRMPVAVDGSNNGIQLLSLLMRDTHGATNTNCSNLEKPIDTYGIIANAVIDTLTAEEENKDLAKYWLDFGIDRSVTKRSVMILPYGGTAYASRQYVEDWYKDALAAKKERVADVVLFNKRIAYLSSIVWQCVCASVDKPKVAMQWMMDCASVLAKADLPIRWKTPVGFPVLQDYKNQKLCYVSTTLGDRVKKVKIYEEGEDSDNRKQINGISPNFIHSLDASVLQRAVCSCKKAGLDSIQVVHDSFATHCTNMDVLSAAVRHSVVSQFSDNLLEKLWEDLSLVLPADLELPRPPELGDFDVREVLGSRYMFA